MLSCSLALDNRADLLGDLAGGDVPGNISEGESVKLMLTCESPWNRVNVELRIEQRFGAMARVPCLPLIRVRSDLRPLG